MAVAFGIAAHTSWMDCLAREWERKHVSITNIGVAGHSETVAQRFERHLRATRHPTDIGHLLVGFALHLRATNKSPMTLKSYTDTLRQFCLYLAENGMPTEIERITREHIEMYLVAQLDQFRPKTAQIRFGDLQQFFKWALEERESPAPR